MNIKIATWNISGGVSKSVEDSNYFDQEKSEKIDETFLNKIIEIINNEKIEIIAFQEIITTERIAYIKKIIDATELKYYNLFELSECNLVENTDAGIAILSKYPIVDHKCLNFTNPNLSKTTKTGLTYYTYDKGFMVAKINLNKDVYINFSTVHGFPFRRFNSNPESHKDVFLEFDNFISDYDNLIIVGDVNAEKAIELLPKINEVTQSIFEEITTIDDKKFDKMFIDNKYKLINKKIIKSLSDHFLCVATIDLNNK